MQLLIDLESGIDPSEQLYEQLRRFIVTGQIKPGSPLPTQKEIQDDLDLANNTIQRAFSKLTHDGLIEGRTSKGTVALTPPREAILAQAAFAFRPAVKEMVALGLTDREITKLVGDVLQGMRRKRSGGDRRMGIRTMAVDQTERRQANGGRGGRRRYEASEGE